MPHALCPAQRECNHAEEQRREYDEADTKLRSIEEKWINNQMAFETYQR